MPLKTSSIKPWLKLYKERAEKCSLLSTEEDNCTKLKNTTLKNSLHLWINSIKLQRSKDSSPMVTSWWIPKKAVHSWSILLMELLHLSTHTKMSKWDILLQLEEHQVSSHLHQWHLQQKLDWECRNWSKMITDHTLHNSEDQPWKWILASITVSQLPLQGNPLLNHW